MYLSKSGKDPQIYFYRTKGFCKWYEKIEVIEAWVLFLMCSPHASHKYAKNFALMMPFHLTALQQENKDCSLWF